MLQHRFNIVAHRTFSAIVFYKGVFSVFFILRNYADYLKCGLLLLYFIFLTVTRDGQNESFLCSIANCIVHSFIE